MKYCNIFRIKITRNSTISQEITPLFNIADSIFTMICTTLFWPLNLYPKTIYNMSWTSLEPYFHSIKGDFRAFQNLVSEHSIAPASLYNLTKSAPDPLCYPGYIKCKILTTLRIFFTTSKYPTFRQKIVCITRLGPKDGSLKI